jgi:hypothetical protein
MLRRTLRGRGASTLPSTKEVQELFNTVIVPQSKGVVLKLSVKDANTLVPYHLGVLKDALQSTNKWLARRAENRIYPSYNAIVSSVLNACQYKATRYAAHYDRLAPAAQSGPTTEQVNRLRQSIQDLCSDEKQPWALLESEAQHWLSQYDYDTIIRVCQELDMRTTEAEAQSCIDAIAFRLEITSMRAV